MLHSLRRRHARFRKTSLLSALLLCVSPLAQADYFLHGAQMADLIGEGRMTGEDGARYDVWLVPGYAGPGRNVVEGWSDAGSDLAAYGHAQTYRGIAGTSGDILRFAGKDTIGQFAFKGSATAWSEGLQTAKARVDRRVFGWWFAYPWAVIEATGESVLRVGLGVPGGIVIGGVGATVVPVAQLGWPLVKGTYHGVGEGTVFPVVAASWNTVIAPPMAVLGQQPTPERADGFWLKRLDPVQTDSEFAATRSDLQKWRESLLSAPAVKALEAESRDNEQRYQQERERLLAELDKRRDEARKQIEARRRAALHEQITETAASSGIDRDKLLQQLQRYGRRPALAALQGGGMGREEAEAALTALAGNAGDGVAPEAPSRRADNEKTDPLKRSLERLGE